MGENTKLRKEGVQNRNPKGLALLRGPQTPSWA